MTTAPSDAAISILYFIIDLATAFFLLFLYAISPTQRPMWKTAVRIGFGAKFIGAILIFAPAAHIVAPLIGKVGTAVMIGLSAFIRYKDADQTELINNHVPKYYLIQTARIFGGLALLGIIVGLVFGQRHDVENKVDKLTMLLEREHTERLKYQQGEEEYRAMILHYVKTGVLPPPKYTQQPKQK